MPESSSKPWIAPSSPNLPCSTGSAASSVDNHGAVLHPLDTVAIEEMVCLRGEWRMERHDVALLEQCAESDVVRRGRGPSVIGERSAAKPSEPVRDRAADASRSNHPDG